MSFEYSDSLRFQGISYLIDSAPLEGCFNKFAVKRFDPIWPVSSRGYTCCWSVEQDCLLLDSLWAPRGAERFGFLRKNCEPVQATWFTGLIHGRSGKRRRTGYPSRAFSDQEVVLDIHNGRVRRYWLLDLHDLPNQTDEELVLSLPTFLWPEHLHSIRHEDY